MKKTILFLILLMLFASVLSTAVFAKQQFIVFLNNEAIELSAPPVFQNQRTMVTLDSDFFKKADVKTKLDEDTKKILIDGKYSTIEFTIGEKSALIHRKFDFTGIPESIEMDVAPYIINDDVYVPLRFAAEGLGALVEWDSVNNSVLVTFKEEMDIIPVETPVEYEEINIADLSDEDELYSWVQANKSTMGIYHKNINNYNYVLICAGEKPTGGYSIEINSVTLVSPGRIYVDAELIKPSLDSIVTQALTYPCKLIAIKSEGEFNVDGVINGSLSNNVEDIAFETISPEAIAADEELSAWVNGLYKQAGFHYRNGEYVYVLVSAGEKNTGGYSVNVDRVIKEQSGDVYIYAVVESPDPDMMVIQIITWPYTVIRFENTDIAQIKGEIKNSSPAKNIIDFN